ncbi:hypothetical protein HK103_000166 [Boothiomyces macroporosus]|uniref:Uncharacterized protein n=1 Tax=Boothiomyces macroporosus TaxID=261099 RepID=A0AAD5UQL4_9FUNG|nr:hypothetical protein HK103_000166 [Boothiomyces macroporosus]
MGQKEIKISASSVLDLKAELSKKEAQVKQKSNPAVVTTRLKNVSKIVKKPKLDMDDEEKSKLEASFVALSRKAQLYEQKQRDQDSDDEGLVDFQMKESAGEIDTSNWVQVTDEFGRTRLVKKDEIHQLEQPKNDTPVIQTNSFAHFNVNYEHRNLGVVHYTLSQDDDVRKKQMDELVQMSKETEAVKYRIQKSRNDRQKAINERLELVRLRNRKRKEAKTKMQVDSLLSSFI